jgi:hypothetical protein
MAGNLLYTAVTSGKKLVVLVGQKNRHCGSEPAKMKRRWDQAAGVAFRRAAKPALMIIPSHHILPARQKFMRKVRGWVMLARRTLSHPGHPTARQTRLIIRLSGSRSVCEPEHVPLP